MENAITALLSWQFILFSLGMFFITWLVRTVVELSAPKIVGNKWWESLVLRFLPCLFGVVLAHFAKMYAYPDGLTSGISRELFGLVAGGLSSLLYAAIKGIIKQDISTYNNTVINQFAPPGTPSSAPNMNSDINPTNNTNNSGNTNS